MSNCVFCKIARKEIASRIVYEDDAVIAFHDVAPQAPTHILFIPKKHVASVTELREEDCSWLSDLFSAIGRVATELGLAGPGFRVVVNHGINAGQAVAHLHFHLLGGRPFGWPPG